MASVTLPNLSLRPFGPVDANPSGVSTRFPDAVLKTVLKRDLDICAFCSFRSARYQSAVALSANLLELENIVTACVFCQQCFYLGEAAAMRSGVLIWLPELTQAELHHLAREIYVTRISTGATAESARGALDQLMSRRQAAKDRLETDDPALLFQRMREPPLLPLEGIRLLPLDRRIVTTMHMEYNAFPQMLAYWRSKEGPLPARGQFPALYGFLEHPLRH